MTKILWFLKFEKVKHSLLSDIISGHYIGGFSSTFSKLSNVRSHDSKFDKIAVRVNSDPGIVSKLFFRGRESYSSTPLGVQPRTIVRECGD